MEQKKSVTIKKDFGKDREPIRARCFSDSGFDWQMLVVNQNWDEGKNIVSIGTKTDPSSVGANKIELFFNIEDVPAVIATLQKVAQDTQKEQFNREINWNLNELNR